MARKLTSEEAKKLGSKGGKKSKRGPSESTDKLRNAIHTFLDNNSEKIEAWMEQVAQDDPKEALKIFKDMAEYALPKLSRAEMRHNVDEQIEGIEVSIKRKDE